MLVNQTMEKIGLLPTALAADLPFAFRSLRNSPGFTITALLTLVLGIGATTAIFSVVYAVLLRPLPYRAPQSLVHIVAEEPGDARSGVPYVLFEALQSRNRALQQMAVYYRNTGFSRVTVGGRNEPESVQAGFSSAELFPVLGLSPAQGRYFDDAEVKRAEPVAVISDQLWQRRFGGGAVLGKTVEVDDRPFTIIGVMPVEFHFPAKETQLWLPITANRFWQERPSPDAIHSRGFFMRWNLVARLKPGRSLDEARQEVLGLASHLAGQDKSWNMGLPVKVSPLSIEIDEKPKLVLVLLLGAVGMVLLIACANVANLLLARGAARNKEFSIRLALGASQGRIVQQILTESLLLAGAATGLAVVFASWSVQLLARWAPADLPRLEETSLDTPVLFFTLCVSVITAVLFGLGPAVRAARSNPEAGLRAGGRGVTGSDSQASRVLIVLEFALAVVLVTAAGLLLRSLWATGGVELGFRPSQVLTIRLQPPAAMPQALRAAFFDRIQERIKSIPGVQSVGGIRGLFELGNAPSNNLRMVEGETVERVAGRPLTWTTVSGDFFQAIGIQLLTGRMFSERDVATSGLVAVVDQSLAKRYWPNQNPIGRRFKGQDRRGTNDDWITVIGVAADARRQGVEQQSTPHVFLWHRQSEPVTEWVIRTSTAPEALMPAVRGAVRGVDARTVIANLMPMEKHLQLQSAERRFETWLLTLFAGLALLLAAVGIYGVMSHATVRRTHEIGVRMALGADRLAVIRMILSQGVGLAAAGLCIGVMLSIAVTQLLSSLLFGVAATDLATFVSASSLLLLVATSATLVPAWRASTADPLHALRAD
jgi:predicted permease